MGSKISLIRCESLGRLDSRPLPACNGFAGLRRIATRCDGTMPFRDRKVGGSNPLAPTTQVRVEPFQRLCGAWGGACPFWGLGTNRAAGRPSSCAAGQFDVDAESFLGRTMTVALRYAPLPFTMAMAASPPASQTRGRITCLNSARSLVGIV